MSQIVDQLSEGVHPVSVSLRPEKTVDAFKRAIDDGYVHVKFTDTQGGTELGLRLDRDASDFKAARFSGQSGHVRLVGALTLDYVNVLCVADINLPSLEGTGHLEVVSS